MNIDIQQPQPFDLVSHEILISGNAVGFESNLTIKVSDGHEEITGTATAGSTSIRQFQAGIDIPSTAAFKSNALLITVTDDSGGGEGQIQTAGIQVLFGPAILPGYLGYFEHEVAVGETLSKLARQYFDNPGQWRPIHQANQHIISNPDVIFPGQILRIPRNV